jgi:hypothetical protein
MGIIKNYHDKKWTLQFLNALYNSIDIDIHQFVTYHIWTVLVQYLICTALSLLYTLSAIFLYTEN